MGIETEDGRQKNFVKLCVSLVFFVVKKYINAEYKK